MKVKAVSGIMLTLLIFSMFSVNMIGITVAQPVHDIAIISVTVTPPPFPIPPPSRMSPPPSFIVSLGDLVNITVLVENQGTATETFDVEFWYFGYGYTMDRLLGTITNITLAAGATTNVTLTWGTANEEIEEYSWTALVDCTIYIEVPRVWGEIDWKDNWFESQPGWLVHDPIPPVANAGPDQTIDQGASIVLDGSSSSDEIAAIIGGETWPYITSYTWTFTDETTKTLTGINPNYTFNTPGIYTITLNVTDVGRNWATDTVAITVLDTTEPVANAGQNQTINVGETAIFDAGASTDNVAIIRYDWDFGDETPTRTGVIAYHTYTQTGTYIVKLTVWDAAGNSDADTVTITVLLDTDGDGKPDTTDPDDDNDGIPDTWETENGLNSLDAADASLDPDGDGLTNLQEYQGGTNPNVSDAQAFPLWVLGAAAAVITGIAIATLFLWRRRK